jgi:hypothetical protein
MGTHTDPRPAEFADDYPEIEQEQIPLGHIVDTVETAQESCWLAFSSDFRVSPKGPPN